MADVPRSASVTSGDPIRCASAVLPLPVFDSGVRTTGDVWLLNVTTAAGFVQGNSYTFFSRPQCVNGTSFYGTLSVVGEAGSSAIGIAIGLSVGFAALLVVVIVVAALLRHHWSRDPLRV